MAVTEWSIRDGRVNLGLKECMHTFCMFITIIASFSHPMPTKGREREGSPREAEVSCFPSAGALLGRREGLHNQSPPFPTPTLPPDEMRRRRRSTNLLGATLPFACAQPLSTRCPSVNTFVNVLGKTYVQELLPFLYLVGTKCCLSFKNFERKRR